MAKDLVNFIHPFSYQKLIITFQKSYAFLILNRVGKVFP